MDVKRYIKKQILSAAVFVAMGIAAGVAAIVWVRFRPVFIGIFSGFFPVGLILLVSYVRAQKKPQMQKNIGMELDERSNFINARAGQRAFWISFWAVFAAVMLNNFVAIPLIFFGIFMILFMPAVYLTLLVIYNKRY
jgi:hypothetical protein